MKRTSTYLLAPVFVLEFASFSRPADLSSFINGGELRNGSERYSKLSLVFKEPRDLKRVELESCDRELKDGVEFYFDPGFRRAFIEGGVKKIKVDVPPDPVKAVAIVFGRNQDFCVKALKLVPKKGNPEELKMARLAEAKFKPASIPGALFDSMPQTEPEDAKEMTIEFTQPQTLDRLRVWQGLASERAKSVSISIDGGAAQSFEVATSAGAQDLKLEKAATAKKVVLKQIGGRLSEVRFANADDEFIPSTLARDESDSRVIASTNLASMLDRELLARLDEKDAWAFRFRSDGTFFIRGYGENMSESRAFSAVGSYRIEKKTKTGAQLQLFGLRAPTAYAWDGTLCPFECGGVVDKKAQLVSDLVELEEGKAGTIMVRNRTSQAKRTLPFSDLKSQYSSIEE